MIPTHGAARMTVLKGMTMLESKDDGTKKERLTLLRWPLWRLNGLYNLLLSSAEAFYP